MEIPGTQVTRAARPKLPTTPNGAKDRYSISGGIFVLWVTWTAPRGPLMDDEGSASSAAHATRQPTLWTADFWRLV